MNQSELPIRIAGDANGFSMTVKVSEYVKRGLTILFAVPVLLALLVFLLYGMIAGNTDVEPDAMPFIGVWVTLSALAGALGLALLVGANYWSERSTVRFDGVRWSMRKHAGAEESLHQFATIRVHKPSQLAKWCALDLTRPGGRAPLRLYGRFQMPKHAHALASHAQWLGGVLRLPVEFDPKLAQSDALGLAEPTAALLCYLPIQGVFLAASIYYILRGDQRPLVHFSARQSLCQTAFTFIVLAAVLVLFGVPVALLGDGPLRVAAIVLLTVALIALVIWNLAAHVVACVRAHRGAIWVMPWLRPFVRRWLPAA